MARQFWRTGIQDVLRLGPGEPTFRHSPFEDRGQALEAAGPKLRPSERSISLQMQLASTIQDIVSRVRGTNRRHFMRAVAVGAAVLAAGVATNCGADVVVSGSLLDAGNQLQADGSASSGEDASSPGLDASPSGPDGSAPAGADASAGGHDAAAAGEDATTTGIDAGGNPHGPPSVTSVSPTSALPGTWITVTGTGFGAFRNSSVVYFGTTQALTHKDWSDSSIRAMVPISAAGSAPVSVTVNGVDSGATAFTIGTPQVFTVDTYVQGGDPDSTAGLTRAWTAAVAAAASNNVIVRFASGKTYDISGTAVTLDKIRTNDWLDTSTWAPSASPTVARTGTVVFDGQGATIKYGTTSARYCWMANPWSSGEGYFTYGNIVINNLHFDDNGGAHANAEAASVIWGNSSTANWSNVVIVNCTQTGAPANTSGVAVYGNCYGVNIGTCCSNSSPAHWNYVSDIVVDKCSLASQTKGIFIGSDGKLGFPGGTDRQHAVQPLLFDRIFIWNTVADIQNYCGTDIHIGSYAPVKSVYIDGATCSSSTDNGIEVDQGVYVTLRNVSFSQLSGGFGYALFGDLHNTALTPTIYLENISYAGPGAVSGWPGTNNGAFSAPQSVGLVGIYNPSNWNTTRSFGNWTMKNLSVTQGAYSATRTPFIAVYSATTAGSPKALLGNITLQGFTLSDATGLEAKAVEFSTNGTSVINVSDVVLNGTPVANTVNYSLAKGLFTISKTGVITHP